MEDGVGDWVFGYGSIINDASRRATLGGAADAAALCDLAASSGWARAWNFRAPSGFTALGVRRADGAAAMCGVLFQIAGAGGALERFDTREAGYDRVPLDRRLLTFVSGSPAAAASLQATLCPA